jgi:hypothetical protein
MKPHFSFTGTLLCAICLTLALGPTALGAGDDWKPVDPAELALKAPVVEKDADAEALFWEVRIDDGEVGELILNHYLRVKVFTERGRESQSRIDLPFGKLFGSNIKIKDIAARTIKPDGTIVELKKEDVFERDVIKVSGVKMKAKSFAMPSVEPGSIIEYRWREVRANQWANYVRLQFQRDIPVQTVKYYLKPYPFPGLSMRAQMFRGTLPPIVKEKNGFYSATMTNLPAYRQEPHMPPEDEVRAWMLIYYSADEKIVPEKFWKEYGKTSYEAYKSRIKVNGCHRRCLDAGREAGETLQLLPRQGQKRQRRCFGHEFGRARQAQREQVAFRYAQARDGRHGRYRFTVCRARHRRRVRRAHRARLGPQRYLLRPGLRQPLFHHLLSHCRQSRRAVALL